jgi:C-terminal processing protease CtpA/Prc
MRGKKLHGREKRKIKHVRANFPAAEAGLREGDTITAVNGHPVIEFDLDKLAKMFKQEGKYLLTVRRGDKIIHSKLKLKRGI